MTLYEARGDFQLNVEMLRRGGLGRLFEAFARLKAQLEGEGLFAAERKRDLPRLPRCIGIVSSPQAAALRDVLAALRRRAPHVPVVLYPTPVQGEAAAQQIATALATASSRGECDVILLCRGGGSIEDLWSFNEEAVARAIVASGVPVVCGVGHETDVTIADFAADLRAATPTAAAEIASAGWYAATGELASLQQGLQQSIRAALDSRMQRLDLAQRGLLHPGERLSRLEQQVARQHTKIAALMQQRIATSAAGIARMHLRLSRARPDPGRIANRLALIEPSLRSSLMRLLDRRTHDLKRLQASMTALSPAATLSRGYGIVRDAAGNIVRDSAQLKRGDHVQLALARGSAEADITATD